VASVCEQRSTKRHDGKNVLVPVDCLQVSIKGLLKNNCMFVENETDMMVVVGSHLKRR
jgi:hypothetical protein